MLCTRAFGFDVAHANSKVRYCARKNLTSAIGNVVVVHIIRLRSVMYTRTIGCNCMHEKIWSHHYSCWGRLLTRDLDGWLS